MTDQDKTAWIKQALDIGPVLLFVAGYLVLRERSFVIAGTEYEGFVVVTALFIPILFATNYLLWKITGKVSRMQILTLVLVIVFGGLTVALNDERFFKMKSTLAFGIFSLLLWIGLWRGQSWLEYILDGAMPLSHEGWMILTRRLAWFFLAVAVANEIIWRSFSTDVFVAWDTFGQMAAMMAFFVSQVGLMKQYGEED
ncbi:MAG: inner membrane-spanning protein YciB [Pseudomonadota bacterium]